MLALKFGVLPVFKVDRLAVQRYQRQLWQVATAEPLGAPLSQLSSCHMICTGLNPARLPPPAFRARSGDAGLD
jgi:hypothetical protein